MIPEYLTYATVDFFTIVFPFLFSWTAAFDFKRHWSFYFPINALVALGYILWDILYTGWGVWGFHHEYTFGISFFGLPLEEILFFICIPYACLFTYYCLKKFIFIKIKPSANKLWLLFSLVFFIIGIYYYDKLYTTAAFLSCSISFLLAYRQRKIRFIHFLLFYLIILIPFFIANGILTGSFMNRVVVFYNDNENLGKRILTIPLEDIFYGLALLHFQVMGYEYLLNKNASHKI